MANPMNADEVETFRDLLLSLRSRIQGDVSQLTDEALGANGREAVSKLSNTPLHMADLGTENYEQELTLGLIENEQEFLEEVQSALGRIAKGSFGLCEECGGSIAKLRLQALPYARYCITCARRQEGDA
jgi:RNA polymerase-binding protein DksA